MLRDEDGLSTSSGLFSMGFRIIVGVVWIDTPFFCAQVGLRLPCTSHRADFSSAYPHVSMTISIMFGVMNVMRYL